MSDDLYEWKDLYNKGYILEEKCDLCNNEELKEKALKLIRKWDKERGEGWSDDSYEIADIMVEFFKELTNERD